MKKKKGTSPTTAPQIRFNYIKSAQFRVIHADGAIGGVTPNGFIHMALFNERAAIPREIVKELKPDGTLGESIRDQTVSRQGLVREMDVDAIFDVATAERLSEWLSGMIKEVKAREKLVTKKKTKKRESK